MYIILYSRAKYVAHFTTFRVRFVATVTAVVIAVALCGPADARAVLATKIVGIELQNARLLRPWSVIAVEVTCGWKEMEFPLVSIRCIYIMYVATCPPRGAL